MVTATVKCPTCGRPIEWSEAFPFRPFCSERCKLIDLGAWLSEQRGIPGEGPVQEPGDTPQRDGSHAGDPHADDSSDR